MSPPSCQYPLKLTELLAPERGQATAGVGVAIQPRAPKSPMNQRRELISYQRRV